VTCSWSVLLLSYVPVMVGVVLFVSVGVTVGVVGGVVSMVRV